MALSRYAAFLRGINVGGRRAFAMAAVREAFAAAGCQRVSTVLATGNVVFDYDADSGDGQLADLIGAALLTRFGLGIRLALRPVEALRRLVEAEPFGGAAVTPETRLYLTLLDEAPTAPPTLPYAFTRCTGTIVACRESDVCSIIHLTPQGGTPEMMAELEKLFGPNITTRNWNTVTRILAAEEK